MRMLPRSSSNTSPSIVVTDAVKVAGSAAAAGASSSSSSSSAAASGGGGGARVKTMVQQQQEQQAAAGSGPLRCPRCDSANTKFCYYNNYSLSQPRHFCKACKRYWTRGGTLRNVPVGGGCRKNKRVKKHSSSTSSAAAAASAAITTTTAPPPVSTCIDHNASSIPMQTSTSDLSSFLYPEMNLGSYCIQPQLSALGLGGLLPPTSLFNTNLADLHQSPFLINDYHPTTTAAETTASCFTSQAASLLVSSLKQPKKVDAYDSWLPYDANLGFLKDVKVEDVVNNTNLIDDNSSAADWQAHSNLFDAINPAVPSSFTGTCDVSSYLYWNQAIGWPDAAANSSVATPPLI